VSRSVSKPIDVLDVPKRWAAGNAPAGHSCQLAGRSQAGAQFESWTQPQPTGSRLYGRLAACATSRFLESPPAPPRRGATPAGQFPS